MMPLRSLLIAAVVLPVAASATAGAWPREVGGGFLSLRHDVAIEGSGGTSAYGEYGLSRRVTAGVQFSSEESDWNAPRAGGFLNIAIGDLSAPHKLAVSVGGSTAATSDTVSAADAARLDLGLHWGRGFESGLGGGWATASYLLHLPHGGADPIHELYGTLGLRPRPGWMVMLSASDYRDGEGSYGKLTPGLGYALHDELWGVLQLSHGVGDERTTALGVSLWWSF